MQRNKIDPTSLRYEHTENLSPQNYETLGNTLYQRLTSVPRAR